MGLYSIENGGQWVGTRSISLVQNVYFRPFILSHLQCSIICNKVPFVIHIPLTSALRMLEHPSSIIFYRFLHFIEHLS